MKKFHLHIDGSSEDIVIKAPDELNIRREEAFAIVLLKLQEIIVDGVYPITKRIWPCIFCDLCFASQADLMTHVRDNAHIRLTAGLHKLSDKYIQEEEKAAGRQPTEPKASSQMKEYAFIPPRMPDAENPDARAKREHNREYARQYYIRKQLEEI